MRIQVFLTIIFSTLFFTAFFIYNAGAQGETFISAVELKDTECSSMQGYSTASQFFDGNGNNVYLCVKREAFVAGNSYVRESYFEMAQGNECIDDPSTNLRKVGAFNDANGRRVFLCSRAHAIDEGQQNLLISDVTVIEENECPSDYVQFGPAISVANGKTIRNCVNFKDSQRITELEGCGHTHYKIGNGCIYDVFPGTSGAEVGRELAGILIPPSHSSCNAQINCVCVGASIKMSNGGWECPVSGGNTGNSVVGGCRDSDNSPSNFEEISNSESIFNKGNVSFNNKTLIDSCDGERVAENYCDANGERKTESVACPTDNTCFSGRCVNPLSDEFSNTCIITNAIWANSETLEEISSAQGGKIQIGDINKKVVLAGTRTLVSGEVVLMVVHANSPACVGKEISFVIFEDDFLGDKRERSDRARITSDGDAIRKISFEWKSDRYLIDDNPEYFFEASIVGEQRKIKSGLLELFPPPDTPVENTTETDGEIKWETYTTHSGRCPRDKFLVGKSEQGKRCAELRTSGNKKVVWEGEVRKTGFGSRLTGRARCRSNEGAVGYGGFDGLECAHMKIQGGEDVVRLPDDIIKKKIKKSGSCDKTQVVYFRNAWSDLFCGVSLKSESSATDSEGESGESEGNSGSGGGNSPGLLGGGGSSLIGDLLKGLLDIVLNVFLR